MRLLINIRLLAFAGACLFSAGLSAQQAVAPAPESFPVRGVLPWHNFLSGPSAWNLEDYERYLDECAEKRINYVAFHNYTGGGERYASYVEPMIKLAYRGILPEASFDHSLTARWGYYPLAVEDFAYGSERALKLSPGAEAFGADAAVLPRDNEGRYKAAQSLMRRVMDMAHARGMEVAMGFEFGVLPPEYFSLNAGDGAFYWPGEANMVPNPCHPISVELLHATIDDILESYPHIDWITLWLNEHSFMGIEVERALKDPLFGALYRKLAPLFSEPGLQERSEDLAFIGVWSLQYIRLAYDYIKKKAPEVKVQLSGWGGGNQLPVILKGLDKGLPKDIVFSCLNPGLGTAPQPGFLAEIAQNRRVWAIPWLEGDHQLWHYQGRVSLMREHVRLAAEQKLDGVVAIHWRTEENRWNFETFARFASAPARDVATQELYRQYLERDCGDLAAEKLSALFARADTAGWRVRLSSPEYFAYTPGWGRLNEEGLERTRELLSAIREVRDGTSAPEHRKNLLWWENTFRFELLLHQVGLGLEPAYKLRKDWHATLVSGEKLPERFSAAREEARKALEATPMEELFKVFTSKIRSRGEQGVLSALNQKLWVEYKALKQFLEDMP